MAQKDREGKQSQPGLVQTFKTVGGYRINKDGSISFYNEVAEERKQQSKE